MKAKIKNFQDLIVWQKAHQLFMDTIKDAKKCSNDRITNIILTQLLKAVSSISANIAEGSARHTGKEFEHYMIIARGSAVETQDWFIKLKDCGLISKEIFEERYNVCEEIRKMLNALIGSSRRRSKKLTNKESY